MRERGPITRRPFHFPAGGKRSCLRQAAPHVLSAPLPLEPRMTAARLIALSLAAALLAGAARAQTPAPLASPVPDKTAALNAAVRSPYAEAAAMKGIGMARTSLDHRFEKD